jgi:hypothetical protein
MAASIGLKGLPLQILNKDLFISLPNVLEYVMYMQQCNRREGLYLKIHRLSIVVGEGKSEVFYRDFTCNQTNDYYILPKDKRVKKSVIEKFEVHGVSHDRYYAVVWLANTDKIQEFAVTLKQMAIDHFALCEKLAKQGYELAKDQTVIPEFTN